MIRVPDGGKPFVPPVTSQQAGAPPKTEAEARPGAKMSQISSNPEVMDTQALATRMAVLAAQAKDKELKFDQIIQRVIDMTGVTNPESAMEEANRKLQKEIENTIDAIKSNKDLMEEAEAWQTLQDLLENASDEFKKAFVNNLETAIKNMRINK